MSTKMSVLVKNDREAAALRKFRKRTKELTFDDMTLLRFLRARDLDLKKAEDMLRSSIDWRLTWEIDSLDNWDPPKEISDGYDLYHCGHDYEGRPVFYAPLGMWTSSRDLFEKGLEEDCLKFAAKSMDKIVYQNLLKTTHQNFVCIVDITGGTYKKAFHEVQNLKGLQDLLRLFRDYEANYPETLCKAFVINAPMVFYWGFNMVKPLMTKHTLSKIEIFNSNADKIREAIHAYLPPEAIPEKLGGSSKMTTFY